jgi:hypothetical protein
MQCPHLPVNLFFYTFDITGRRNHKPHDGNLCMLYLVMAIFHGCMRCMSLACMSSLHTMQVVEPKKAKLAEAEAQYQTIMAALETKQTELKGLMDRLAGMEAGLKANTVKKEGLESEIELCSLKLQRAEKLIGGLSGEKARWQDAASLLAKAHVSLCMGRN